MALVEVDYLLQNVEGLLIFKKENPLLVKLTNQQLSSFELVFQLSGLLDITPTTRILIGKTARAFREAFILLMSEKAVLGVYMLKLALEHTRDAMRLLDDQTKSDWYTNKNQLSEDTLKLHNDFFSFDKTNQPEKFLSELYDSCSKSHLAYEITKEAPTVVDWKELGKTNGWLWNSALLRTQSLLIEKLNKYCDKNDEESKKLIKQWLKEANVSSKKIMTWNKNISSNH